MNKKILLFLLALPVFSVWISLIVLDPYRSESSSIHFPAAKAQSGVADTFFNQTRIINFNEQGLPKSKIMGRQIFHYPGADDSEIEQPEITFFRPTGAPVLITADHGRINQQGDRVVLTGNTKIIREKTEFNPFSKLETSQLIIWPDKDFVETDRLVHIYSEATTASGVGMKAYLAQEHYFLLDRVKARHFSARSLGIGERAPSDNP